MRILIAGCGYVGGRLAEVLIDGSSSASAASYSGGAPEVFAVRRHLPEPITLPGVRWVAADLVAGDLTGLPGDLDAVVIAAAPGRGGPDAYRDVYERLVTRVVEHAARTSRAMPRIVLTSSTSVYPQGDGALVTEESLAEPESPNGRWIRVGEQVVADARGVAVRLGGIYGPGRMSFLESVRRGEISVNPRASAFTNRIHRDDAAGILQHLMLLEKPHAIYNGVDCESATRAEVARWLADRIGVPLRETQTEEESQILRGNKRVSNARLIASGYRFAFPSFREGYAAASAQGV